MTRAPIPIRLLTGLLAVLSLAACVSLPEGKPPPQRYVLAPLAAAEGPSLDARIEVVLPRVPAGLASDRIAVLRGGRRLDHFAGARWAAPLPELLRDFFATSVENRLGAVAWDPTPARYRLVTAVRDFQAEYPEGNGAPLVRLSLVTVLWDQARGEVVLRRKREAVREVPANRLEAVTAALEGLLQEMAGDFIDQARGRLAGDQGAG